MERRDRQMGNNRQMGQHLTKKLPRGPPTGPKARQGDFSSSGKLNITDLKTDIVTPDNKAKVNSIDNLYNLVGAKTSYFGKLL